MVEWDDGLVLDTHMRMSGSWHLYRARRQLAASVHADARGDRGRGLGGGVLQRSARRDLSASIDKRRHPGMGRLGPDLCTSDTDLGAVVNLLLTYPDPTARLGEVLLDQRVMCGVGNVYRCEVLWATELSPYAQVGTHQRARCDPAGEHRGDDVARRTSTTPSASRLPGARGGLAVYGRNGQRCDRCGETIECRRMGEHNRILYWCPGCQTHLDPKLERSSDDTPMDPHPAAQRWLAELPWNRDAG